MKLALITALTLGATSFGSIAAADVDVNVRVDSRGYFTRDIPYRYDRDRDGVADRYERNDSRDGRYGDRGERWNNRWVPLARGYSGSADKQTVALNGRGFDKIKIQAERGTPMVQKIVIEYSGDPNVQVVEMNRRMQRGSDREIRLNSNRGINRIVVYTEPRARGSYSIYGV